MRLPLNQFKASRSGHNMSLIALGNSKIFIKSSSTETKESSYVTRQ